MNQSRRQFSSARQTLYYVGMGLIAIGVLLFLSTFVSFAVSFGDSTDFHARAKSEMFRALSGMCLMVVGSIAMTIGSQGLAGSGVILDPEQARKDVEPWSRMSGGMIDDALSEVEVVKKIADRIDDPKPTSTSTSTVMVRCLKCRTLNDEHAKFCQECGSAM